MMKRHIQNKRGQALVEFALILPLLVILVFGIIEMARLMQAWITLQNSARAAARWASIGAVKWDIFDVAYDPATTPQDQAVLDGIVPCVLTDERGTIATIGGVERYQGGSESLFATWYDGINCDPRIEDHQVMRRDILRIFSVIHEARTVSSGLGLAPAYNGWNWDAIPPSAASQMLYDVWSQPFPGNHEEAGYFYVDICSSNRTPINIDSTTVRDNGWRFIAIRNEGDRTLATGTNPESPRAGYDEEAPMCMLSEIPPEENPDGSPNTERLINAGHRWWDAGGPGEQIIVFIRFNHPWITPINADGGYITLNTRRSSVNESFRAPKAVGAFQRSLPPGRDDNATPRFTLTPTDTLVPTNTLTPTVTPSQTPTSTRIPFECSRIQMVWAEVPFSGNAMFVSIINNNLEAITLDRVVLEWYSSPSYPAMYARAFSLDNGTHWQGGVPSSTPQTVVDTSVDGTFYDTAFRTVGGQNIGIWNAIFLNGPSNLSSAFLISDFEGDFFFTGPDAQACTISLVRPPRPTSEPTLTPTAGPSPTRTPDCATAQDISVRFGNADGSGGFDSFDGSVYFTVTNSGAQSTYLLGFDLVWPDPTHPQINRPAGDYYLRRVTVGGDSPADPLSQTVWTSSGVGEDASGNTRTTLPFDYGTRSTTEGTWLANAIIRPGQTRIYFDFDGFPGSLQNAMGVQRHHFNNSLLYIGCSFLSTPGGGPGTYIPPTGVIGIVEPSPTVTNTPGPSPTTGPSFTPSNTRTPTDTRTPTRTFTPSHTPTPSNTPGTPTPTPLNQLTPTVGGGGES